MLVYHVMAKINIYIVTAAQTRRGGRPGCPSCLGPSTAVWLLLHLARATPPSLSIKALELFDIDVRHCFSQCTAVDTSDEAWLQAQLSLCRGGLGLWSLSSHAAAAFIASLCSSDISSLSSLHLTSAIGKFNSSVSPSDVVSVESFA